MEVENKKPTLERFYINLLDLIDVIKSIISEHKFESNLNINLIDLLTQYVQFWNQDQKKSALEAFINSTHSYWADQIYKRNKDFFIKNELKFFPSFSKYMNDVNKLISECNEEDQDIIWEYVHVFVKQSISFIHEMRKVSSEDENYMKHIDLKQYAHLWKVKLE